LAGSYIKDATDRIWNDDTETKEWSTFMDRYHPDGDKTSVFTVFGYMAAKACPETAASLKGLKFPMLRGSQSTLGRRIMSDQAAADAVA
jgi:hypothetical protein